jgi:GR25 family glycosyltransferase involved in LPS biosynthesis
MLDYFDKIYVLSLKRNTQRRQIVKERLSKVGLDFEFFDACDGQVFDHIWKKLQNPNFTTKNYVACQISHLQIYNDALSQGYKRILILEDDVKPHKDIVNIFENYKSQIPDDYDLLYLGWIPLNDDCSMWDYSQINDRFASSNILHAKNLWGLYAYSPSIELMKEMVDLYNRDFPMEIDRYFVNNIQQQRKSYAIWTQLFGHDIMVSNTGGFVDRQSLVKSIDHRGANSEDYL